MSERPTSLDLRSLLQASDTQHFVIGQADNEPGQGIRQGEISMPYTAREAHMHVIGRTRSGKSRFLFDCIRQDILNGYGLCLLDPHGELCDLVTNWLAQNQRLVNRLSNIHPVRFTDTSTTLRFNPLHINKPEEAYTVAGNVVDAITRIYGGDNPNETPLFAYVLDITCTILALRGLPLAAATAFLLNDANHRDLRNQISAGVPDPYFRELGMQFSQMGGKEFREVVGSTARRLHGFLRNPAVKRIFSTTENTLNLREAMDEGHILLLNTTKQGSTLLKRELDTIGALFVNNIFATAETRPERPKPHPFMLYIDEVQNYVNNDIEDILSQAAKRGLYLTLSHQHLAQLAAAGELVYSGVIAGTLIKTVFQVRSEDADVLVDELFADEIDFQRVKEKLISPHVVDHELTETRSHHTAQGRADGRGHTDAKSESQAEGDSEAVGEFSSAMEGLSMPGDLSGDMSALSSTMFESMGSGASSISGSYAMHGHSVAQADTTSTVESRMEGEGVSETYKPVIEWFSTQTYTLEEQRYALKRRLSHQPKRHGYIAVGREGTRGFTTRDIPDPLHIPDIEADVLAELREKSPWISRAADVPALIEPPSIPGLEAVDENDDPFT